MVTGILYIVKWITPGIRCTVAVMALRTEKQRQELCRNCPVATVADLIGDPCTLLVMRDLLDGPRRFGELDESLGMSTRTLSKTLRRLADCALIEHGADGAYLLTKTGKDFRPVIQAMRRYGEKYLTGKPVRKAQKLR